MKKFCLLVICVTVAHSLYGYNLRRISKHDGLSNSSIQTICQDSDGLMWLGSIDGLNIYDSRTLRTLRMPDSESLSGNLIEDMIEAEPGIFWIQTNYGLDRYDKRRRSVTRYDTYSANYRLRSGGDTELLFIRENGGKSQLVYYNEKSSSFAHLPLERVEYNNLLDYFVTDDNKLYLLCRRGQNATFSLVRDDGGNCTLIPSTDVIAHPLGFRYAFHENAVAYFVDTAGVLYEYNTDEKKKYYVADISAEIARCGNISSIVKSGSDYFVGFSSNGLICLRNTPERDQHYRTEQIDIQVGIFCLLKDRRQDIVWIGTDGQGVYIYSDDSYSVKSTFLENLTIDVSKPVRAMLLDEDNSLWIGTKGDGLLRLRDYDLNRSVYAHEKEHYNTLNSGISTNSVFSLGKGPDGILWIGTHGGLDRFDYNTGTIQRLEVRVDGEPVRSVYGIVQQSRDTLWLATVGMGMVRIDLAWNGREPRAVSAERFTTGEGGSSANFFFTAYGEDPGKIWFGNRGYGAYCYDIQEKTFRTVRFDNDKLHRTLNDIFCIMKGDSGEMWFGTGAGLVRQTPDGKITVFGEQSGFRNSTIHGMLKGERGDIWLSTNFGIIRFNTNTETFVTYSRKATSDVVEFSDGAFFRSEDRNMLFFGGINGFVTILENEYTVSADYVPPIVIDRLTIFGEEHNVYDYLSDDHGKNPLLKLNYRENFFSLSLTAVDYIDGDNYTYTYKLEGMNDAWIDNGSNNTIYFTNTAPGYYTLIVRCMNMEAGTDGGEYSINIRITPPWYMSAVAYVVFSIFGLAGLWLVIRFIIRRNERRRKVIIDRMKEQHEKEVYESKLRFFTNIAHEFCTPLTLIQGPCDRIISYKGSDQFIMRYAGLIQRNADRMNDLIQDLIEFRRIETGNKTPHIEPVDLSNLVASIFDNFTELAESRGFTFTCDIPSGIVWNTDRDFMTTILGNLISNAFKYTNSNGAIGVRLRVGEDGIKLVVSNTGKGIRPENIERLFDRYSILDDFEYHNGKSQTRNGLGLAISENMIQLLGGCIEVSSEMGVETRFTMHLPQAEPLAPNLGKGIDFDKAFANTVPPLKDYPAEAELPQYDFDERKPTVMVIDDEYDMMWFISEIFSAEFNIIPVNRSSMVSELLEKEIPNVIICDVMMPGIDGISITRQLKTNPKTAHVPLILVSAKHHVDEQIKGLEAGADLYITKPFNVDYLRTSVRHLISRKAMLKEYFASPLSAYELVGGKMAHIDQRRFIQQVLDIINDNLANKKLSVQFIADKMNMSTRHLYRRIQDAGAESPLQMIHQCRLRVARELLQNTTLTIDEIIYKSGFANRGPFFRAFSEKFGCTPREYRERHVKP